MRVAATLFTEIEDLENGPPGGILYGVSYSTGEVCAMINRAFTWLLN